MNLDSSDCIAQPSGIFYSATILQTFVFPEATRNSTAGTDSSSSSSYFSGQQQHCGYYWRQYPAVLLVIVAAGVGSITFTRREFSRRTISIPQHPQPQQPPQNHENFFLTSSAKTTTTELPPPQQATTHSNPTPTATPPHLFQSTWMTLLAGKAVSVVPEPLPTKQNIFASMTNFHSVYQRHGRKRVNSNNSNSDSRKRQQNHSNSQQNAQS
ncbi:hypothetical protein BDR26DRAFT_42600 [Obelidium mucronatum]|nr:hypothetical protein BDR26DRAFT_42600 [Obelidium mucronatum]